MNKNIKIIIALIAVIILIGGYFTINTINNKVKTEVRYALLDAKLDDFVRYENVKLKTLNQRIEMQDVILDIGKLLQDKKLYRDDKGIKVSIKNLSFKPPEKSTNGTREIDVRFTDLASIGSNELPFEVAKVLKKMNVNELSASGELLIKLVPSGDSRLFIHLYNEKISDIKIEITSDYANPVIDLIDRAFDNERNGLAKGFMEFMFTLPSLQISSMDITFKEYIDNDLILRDYNLSSLQLPGVTKNIDDIADDHSNIMLADYVDLGLSARTSDQYKAILMNAIADKKALNIKINPAQSIKLRYLKDFTANDINDVIEELNFELSN